MSFKKTSLMIASVVCFFVFLMTVSAGSAAAASKIVYVCDTQTDPSAPGDIEEICTMNPDGSGSTQVTSFQDSEFDIDGLTWSPDGSQIGFFGGMVLQAADTFYVVDSDGSNLVSVVPAIPFNKKLEWSPELPASVASVSPFGQFVIVFLLGGASALWMTKRRQAASLAT